MKVNPAKDHQRVNVITLGCSKNTWDSEVLMGQLEGNKIPVVHQENVRSGDTVVINTCGFIENARQESIDHILRFARAKKEGNIRHLVVMGCLSERYKPVLEKEIPEVDVYFGSLDLPGILSHFNAIYKYELLGERQLVTPSHYAYFKISEGCNRPCSFCAIPLMRGKHRSFPIEDLEEQARKLAQNGTRELILIAQDLTYYGLDIYGKRRLGELLEGLSSVKGIRWIRLQYAYPSGFPLEVLDVIRERENICNYLDMPLQHISNKLLKAMRRGINKEKTLQLLDTIRSKVPGVTLRTTLLTGHPGETEEDFEELTEFVEEQKFDRLGVFPYSHEENTHAHKTMEDEVPEKIKQMRADRIMEVQRAISAEKNRKLAGKNFPVMVDRIEDDFFIARTEGDSPEVDNEVLIPADEHYLRIGEIVPVKIVRALDYDLFAKPV